MLVANIKIEKPLNIREDSDCMQTCPCNEYPHTPQLSYSKTGVYSGIPCFHIFALKHGLWVLVRTASLRRF